MATISNAVQFRSAREFSAWIGLVLRQHSSGGKERLGGISKRGDAYLRRLLIHGARIARPAASKRRTERPDTCLQMPCRQPSHLPLAGAVHPTRSEILTEALELASTMLSIDRLSQTVDHLTRVAKSPQSRAVISRA